MGILSYPGQVNLGILESPCSVFRSHLPIFSIGPGAAPGVLKTNEIFRTLPIEQYGYDFATPQGNTRGSRSSARKTKSSESSWHVWIKSKPVGPRFEIRVQHPNYTRHSLKEGSVKLADALCSGANYRPKGKLLVLARELCLINVISYKSAQWDNLRPANTSKSQRLLGKTGFRFLPKGRKGAAATYLLV